MDYDDYGNTLNSSEASIIMMNSGMLLVFLMVSKDHVDVHWDYDNAEYTPETSGNSMLLMANENMLMLLDCH